MSINNLCQNQEILEELGHCLAPYINGGGSSGSSVNSYFSYDDDTVLPVNSSGVIVVNTPITITTSGYVLITINCKFVNLTTSSGAVGFTFELSPVIGLVECDGFLFGQVGLSNSVFGQFRSSSIVSAGTYNLIISAFTTISSSGTIDYAGNSISILSGLQ